MTDNWSGRSIEQAFRAEDRETYAIPLSLIIGFVWGVFVGMLIMRITE